MKTLNQNELKSIEGGRTYWVFGIPIKVRDDLAEIIDDTLEILYPTHPD